MLPTRRHSTWLLLATTLVAVLWPCSDAQALNYYQQNRNRYQTGRVTYVYGGNQDLYRAGGGMHQRTIQPRGRDLDRSKSRGLGYTDGRQASRYSGIRRSPSGRRTGRWYR